MCPECLFCASSYLNNVGNNLFDLVPRHLHRVVLHRYRRLVSAVTFAHQIDRLAFVIRILVDSRLDLRTHGCREQQHLHRLFRGGLGLGHNRANNLLEHLLEPHVKHSVRLVQHHKLEVVQREPIGLHQVANPAWRANNDVGARAQPIELWVVRHSTVHRQRGELGRNGRALVRRLLGELTGGRQHKTPRFPPTNCPTTRIRQQNIYHREKKSESFAGTARWRQSGQRE